MANIVNNPPRLPLIMPSILSADFARMGHDVKQVIDGGADGIHVDVMDGHFVPNLTMGPALVNSLRKAFSDVYLDCHLMVTRPEDYIDSFAKAGADCFTFHIEATLGRKQGEGTELELIDHVKKAGMQVGIALNPSTPAFAVEHLVDKVDLMLVMSVHPGFSGQAFMPEVLPKTRRLRDLLATSARLEMDGGVAPVNAAAVRDAGCDMIVAASAIFGLPDAKDRAAAIAALRGV